MPQRIPVEFQLLADVARAFAESLDLEKTLESILRTLEKHMMLSHGVITLLDAGTEKLHIKSARGISEASQREVRYRVGEGVTGLVVQTGKEIVVPDVSQDPRFLSKTRKRELEPGEKLAFVCVPIKLEGETIGALSVDRKVQIEDDFDMHVHVLNILSTMIAQAVKLSRLVERNRQALVSENMRLQKELKTKYNLHNFIGASDNIIEVYHLVEHVADSSATVLIRGESGTGKDLVANAIHYNSARAKKPFVKVNCTALSENLLESELFGHERGAFTGATERKKGRFEVADGGTLFLDEIGDISPALQVKLLRALQFKEFERVGGHETIKSNVRIVAATNKNLEEEIATGNFREDLYYRINVFPIDVPPLRSRGDDIMLLADFFISKFAEENGKVITQLSLEAAEMLKNNPWTGNVRELENCMERAVLLCHGETILPMHLPTSLQGAEATSVLANPSFDTGATLSVCVENLEKELITKALRKTNGSLRKAAKELGITERVLGYKLKKYEISRN